MSARSFGVSLKCLPRTLERQGHEMEPEGLLETLFRGHRVNAFHHRTSQKLAILRMQRTASFLNRKRHT